MNLGSQPFVEERHIPQRCSHYLLTQFHRLKYLSAWFHSFAVFSLPLKKRGKWKTLDFISWFDIFDMLNSGAVNHPWGLIERITCWMDPKCGMHKWSRKNMVHVTPHHLSMCPQGHIETRMLRGLRAFLRFHPALLQKVIFWSLCKTCFWRTGGFEPFQTKTHGFTENLCFGSVWAKGRTNERQKIRLSQFSCRMNENRPSDAAT